MDVTIYEAAGGHEALLAIAQAWHVRCLDDPELNHPFSHPGHPDHLERLAAYWGEALGGPADYTGQLADHSHVMRMHAGNGVHDSLDRRAVETFALALDDAGIPDDPRLRTALVDYFRWSTALMSSYPDTPDDVPADLPLPKWSWDGLVG